VHQDTVVALQNQLVAQEQLQLGASGYTSLIIPNANFSLVDKVRPHEQLQQARLGVGVGQAEAISCKA
jgi:hypothetical protein